MSSFNFLASASSSAVVGANKLLETVEGYIPKAFEFLLNVVVAIVILIIGRIIIKYMMKLVKKFFDKVDIEVSIEKFLESIIKVVLHVILIIIICDIVGINTASFIAVLGTLGVTVGLALQGSLSNFAGGVLIILLKPFKVGDYIIDNGSGIEGTVHKVDLFYTKLKTGDNKAVLIPNGSLSNSTITNLTRYDERRIDITFGIGYGEDIEKAKQIIMEIATNDEGVLNEPATAVIVSELAASQVTIKLRAWCKTENYWDVYFRLNENVKKALDKNGIEIPFNQLQVYVKNN